MSQCIYSDFCINLTQDVYVNNWRKLFVDWKNKYLRNIGSMESTNNTYISILYIFSYICIYIFFFLSKKIYSLWKPFIPCSLWKQLFILLKQKNQGAGKYVINTTRI